MVSVELLLFYVVIFGKAVYNTSKEFIERRCVKMELAKITSKGQITIPIMIRKLLNLNDGDKVAFIEKDGTFVMVNPIALAIDEVRAEFAGEADRLGLKNEQDVADMVNAIRKERNW